MDISQIIFIVLLVLLVGGGAFYLMHQRSQLQQSISNLRRPEINRSFGWQPEVQREFRRVFSMTSAQGREGLIKRWMDRNCYDRTEAMRPTIEEWRQDYTRFAGFPKGCIDSLDRRVGWAGSIELQRWLDRAWPRYLFLPGHGMRAHGSDVLQ
jgi:hypothetical protein